MMELIEIKTQRLKLRQWKKEDKPLFAKINADPDVMQFYPSVLDEKESNDLAEKMEFLINENGWGFWAVELRNENKFIGFVGLHEPEYDLPVRPCTEIGWRLAKEYWGYGYATEAAKACLEVAFVKLELSEVYSYTPTSNNKSQAVMERLGMVNTNNNFDHPMIPENSSLSEHLLYKVDKQGWENTYLNVRI